MFSRNHHHHSHTPSTPDHPPSLSPLQLPTGYKWLFLYLFPILPLLLSYAVNITHFLSPYPDLSDFSGLLSTTTVAADLSQRTSLTLLAVSNSVLRSSDLIRRSPSSTNMADPLPVHSLSHRLRCRFLFLKPPTSAFVLLLQAPASAASAFSAGRTSKLSSTPGKSLAHTASRLPLKSKNTTRIKGILEVLKP